MRILASVPERLSVRLPAGKPKVDNDPGGDLLGSRVKPTRNHYDERFSLFPILWGLGVGLAWGLGELAVSALSLGYLSRVFVAPVLLTDGAAGLLFGVALCGARSLGGVQGRALVAAALIWLPALLYTALKVQADLLPTLAWWHLASLLNLLVLLALGLWGAHRGFIRLLEPRVRTDLAALVVGSATMGITLVGVGLSVRLYGRFPNGLWAWLAALGLPVLADRAGRDLSQALSPLSGTQQSRGRYAFAALFAFLVLSGWEYFDQRSRLLQHFSRAGQPVSGSPSGSYNLILIVLSGVRVDHLTAYGYSVGASPVLASVARTADRYERCYSTSSSSEAAIQGLMTGLPPSLLSQQAERLLSAPEGPGARRPGDSLAEVLHWMGYRTVAVTAHAEDSPDSFDFSQGFDVYDGRRRLRLAQSETPLLFTLHRRLDAWATDWFRGAMPWLRGEYAYRFQPQRSVEEVMQAVAFQLRAPRRQPLFLLLQLTDAHPPLVPPVEFLPSGEGIDPALWGGLSAEEVEQINCGQRHLSQAEKRTIRALYDGEIQYMDHWLGRLLESLENTRVLAHSLVVVTSDCGVLLGDEEYLGTGVGLVPAALHVPLIVKRPGQKQGQRFAEPVSLAQVKSLILRELGVTHQAGPGEYVFEPSLEQLLVAEWTPSPELLGACADQWPEQLKAVIRGRRMLVTDLESERRLYDLSTPGQDVPISIEDATAEAAYLEQRLEDWLAAWAKEEPAR